MPAPVRSLVVWCADWPVVAHGVPAGVPAAVVVANQVVAANDAARAEGVRRGQRRRQAQGACPSLVVLERDRSREARAFEPALAAVEQFAPRLEVTRPGSCTVPTRGPARYFGGDHRLAGLVAARVAAALEGRAAVRVGVADGPFAAGLAARSVPPGGIRVVPVGQAPQFLAPLPVTVLERPELTGVLVRLGLGTLGAFATLAAADVAGRFGTEGLAAHRLAAGLEDRPPDARLPPPELAVARELDPPVERIEQVAFAARELAAELAEALGGRGLACTRVAVEADTEHGESLARTWRAEGAMGPSAIADRARWQLDAWLHAPAARRPTGGLTRLRLVPEEVVGATGRQLGLWGGPSPADERAARGLARVQALVGPEAVRVPEPRGGRGPGERFALVPAATVELVGRRLEGPGRGRSATAPWPGALPVPAPAVVHPVPRPVELRDATGAVVSVSGRGLLSGAPVTLVPAGGASVAVSAWAGPWPVDERWWDRAHRRVARLQVLGADGVAHLLGLCGGTWRIEATYD